jgi:hypothetical protein
MAFGAENSRSTESKRASVAMPVMRVGPVRMSVDEGVVLVRVGMGFFGHHLVVMIMMAIIVRMRVIVAQLFVGMLVTVPLGQM